MQTSTSNYKAEHKPTFHLIGNAYAEFFKAAKMQVLSYVPNAGCVTEATSESVESTAQQER